MTDINETPPAPVALDGPPPEINIDLPIPLGQPPEIGAPNTKLGALPLYGTPEALFYPPGGEWNDTPNCCSPRNPTIPTGDEGQITGTLQSARGDHLWLSSKSVHQHPMRPGDDLGASAPENADAPAPDDEEYEYDDSDDEDDDANVITAADDKDESRPKPARKRKVKRKVAKKR